MPAEEIALLGAELRAELNGLIVELLDGVIEPAARETDEVWAELERLEVEVNELASEQAELGRLQEWLTAGFYADAPPIALPVAPAAPEPADDAPAGSEAARLLAAAPPSLPGGASRPEMGIDAAPSRPREWEMPSAPPSSAERFSAADEDAPTIRRTSPFDPSAGAGDGDRFDQLGDGGSRDLNPFAPPRDAGSADRDRWGDASPTSEARRGGFDADPHRPAQAKGGGGIGGLGELAALAGLGGLDLPFTADEPPAERETPAAEARRPASPQPPASARSASPERSRSAPDSPTATDRDPSPATPAQPIRLRGWPEAASAERSGSSGGWSDGSAAARSASSETMGEAASAAMTAGELARLDAERAARSWDALMAMAGAAEVAFPFERMPGEAADEVDLAPAPLPRPASPSLPASGGGGADAMDGPWMADADERTVAQVGRMAGPRLRPAAEILGVLGTSPAASAEPIVPPAAGAPRTIIAPPQPVARRDAEWAAAVDAAEAAEWMPAADAATLPAEVPTVLVRGTVDPAADELTEPPSWPEADVTDVLDALSREIMHEYRRYYGE
ncbi:MAG TPA: hypothetical protein VFR81_09800 [Longimicrobium sp.]|nr:hypothetical protein [Longimicrobium sp.]